MQKFLNISLGVLTCIGFACCSGDKPKREVNALYVEVYMGKKSKIDKRYLMDSIESGINRAFGLLPLERSASRHEIRIYYASVWFERFLRQRYDSGILISELFDCGTKTVNDSLIMTIGTKITDTRPYPRSSFLNTLSLPDYKFAESNYEGVLDGGNLHFIQIKEPGSKKKMIYVDDPFELESTDIEVKRICDYIRTLKTEFDFNMFDKWEDVKATAFLRN